MCKMFKVGDKVRRKASTITDGTYWMVGQDTITVSAVSVSGQAGAFEGAPMVAFEEVHTGFYLADAFDLVAPAKEQWIVVKLVTTIYESQEAALKALVKAGQYDHEVVKVSEMYTPEITLVKKEV